MLNLKYIILILYILSMVLIFMPDFAFAFGNFPLRYLFLCVFTFLGIYAVFNFNTITNLLYSVYKNTSFKYLIYFLLYVVISSITLSFLHVYKNNVSYVLQLVFLYIIPCFSLTAIFVNKLISFETFIKFWIIMINIVLIYGCLDYIGSLFHISFIQDLHNTLVSTRTLFSDNISLVEGKARLRSFFGEPGWFGGFIFMNFPLIYKLSSFKGKIFKRATLDKILVKPLAIFTWICVFLSKSPIWLIFCVVQFLIMFRVKIMKTIFNFKTFTVIFSSILFSIFGYLITLKIFGISFNLSQLERIQTTLIAISTSFEKFTEEEISLATRIVSYFNLIRMWLEHLLFGIGLGNEKFDLIPYFINCPIPMTIENYSWIENSFKTGQIMSNQTIFLKLLSSTGIVGFSLFYLYIYICVNAVNKIHNILANNNISKCFISGYHGSLVAFIAYNFYDSLISSPYTWFFLGISSAICMYGIKIAKFGDDS